jgi:uncharacterized membrane protein YccC
MLHDQITVEPGRAHVVEWIVTAPPHTGSTEVTVPTTGDAALREDAASSRAGTRLAIAVLIAIAAVSAIGATRIKIGS